MTSGEKSSICLPGSVQCRLGKPLVRTMPVFKRITRWPRAIPKYGADFPRYVGLMEQFEKDHPGIQIAGHMRNGISLPDCINAGRAAAERVMA